MPEIFVTAMDGQYFAEVIAEIGTEDERVLYSTGFFKTSRMAVANAERWVKNNPAFCARTN